MFGLRLLGIGRGRGATEASGSLFVVSFFLLAPSFFSDLLEMHIPVDGKSGLRLFFPHLRGMVEVR